jgi:hypothetical protein
VKRKVLLFEVPEHVVCGPVENGGASPTPGCAEKRWPVSVVVSPRALWHDSDFLVCGCR